jgi:aspartate/glutamate racemase
MHVGLIGGIGPAATEFYYRGLTDRHAKSGTRLRTNPLTRESAARKMVLLGRSSPS